jgi:hypothetical protein
VAAFLGFIHGWPRPHPSLPLAQAKPAGRRRERRSGAVGQRQRERQRKRERQRWRQQRGQPAPQARTARRRRGRQRRQRRRRRARPGLPARGVQAGPHLHRGAAGAAAAGGRKASTGQRCLCRPELVADAPTPRASPSRAPPLPPLPLPPALPAARTTKNPQLTVGQPNAFYRQKAVNSAITKLNAMTRPLRLKARAGPLSLGLWANARPARFLSTPAHVHGAPPRGRRPFAAHQAPLAPCHRSCLADRVDLPLPSRPPRTWRGSSRARRRSPRWGQEGWCPRCAPPHVHPPSAACCSPPAARDAAVGCMKASSLLPLRPLPAAAAPAAGEGDPVHRQPAARAGAQGQRPAAGRAAVHEVSPCLGGTGPLRAPWELAAPDGTICMPNRSPKTHVPNPTRPPPQPPNPRVWGVGDNTAQRFYAQGCRTLDDLRKLEGISELQRVGLKYFEDFEVRGSSQGRRGRRALLRFLLPASPPTQLQALACSRAPPPRLNDTLIVVPPSPPTPSCASCGTRWPRRRASSATPSPRSSRWVGGWVWAAARATVAAAAQEPVLQARAARLALDPARPWYGSPRPASLPCPTLAPPQESPDLGTPAGMTREQLVNAGLHVRCMGSYLVSPAGRVGGLGPPANLADSLQSRPQPRPPPPRAACRPPLPPPQRGLPDSGDLDVICAPPKM